MLVVYCPPRPLPNLLRFGEVGEGVEIGGCGCGVGQGWWGEGWGGGKGGGNGRN